MKRKRHQRSASQPAELERSLARATEWHQRGRLDRAEALYGQVLRVAPDHADALYLLGTLYHQQGHHRQAVEHLQAALRYFQRNPSPTLAAVGFNLGNACFELGRHADAAAAYRAALAVAPDDPELLNNLGNALSAGGEHREAVACYRHCATLHPHHVGVRHNLVTALRRAGEAREAIAVCQDILQLRPDDAQTAGQLAELLQQVGHEEAAADHYRALLRQQPEDAELHFALGVCLQRLGRLDEAMRHLSRATELRPTLAEAHYNLATNGHFRPDSAYLARLEALAGDTSLTDEVRARLHFALGHLHDRGTDTERAFGHFRTANRLKARTRAFDPQAHTVYIDSLMDTFTAEFFDRRGGFGLDDERPVFIVGMPRSGTTLIEQILASHSAFHGAGERDTLPRLVAELPARLGDAQPFPRCLERLDAETSRQLARHYLGRLPAVDPHVQRISDKLPGNYARLGLIALLLPRARIIHVRRDPLDTCLSCYFHDFARAQRFSHDLNHLAGVYRDYRRIMAHWRATLLLRLLDVDYEQLVREPDTTVHTLLDFCGLERDDRCLAFYRNPRPVATASFWQVRQPLYPDAVGRWRRYRNHLQSLIDHFEQHDISPCTDTNS